MFRRKLVELGLSNNFAEHALSLLDDCFTLEQLEASLHLALRENRAQQEQLALIVEGVLTHVSDYATTFGTIPLDQLLSAMEPA